MSSFSTSRMPLCLLISLFLNPISILSSSKNPNSNFFDSHVSLYGDAHFTNQGSTITLTNPSATSSGMITYNKPLTLLDTTNPRNGVSFSANFVFSISPDNGDGVMFLIAPEDLILKFPGEGKSGLSGKDRVFGVEFGTSVNGNAIGVIDVSKLGSVGTVNVSSIGLVLNSGVKLQSWIDYDASGKRIEVRLSEFGSPKPYEYALFSYSIDLAKMWKNEEVSVGISASNGNSLQISSVYSCKFLVRHVLSSVHSQPLDPALFKETDQRVDADQVYEQKSGFFPLSLLAGLIFTTGCGALVTFMVLFLWVVFVDRHRVPSQPDFKYENITVVVENDKDDLIK